MIGSFLNSFVFMPVNFLLPQFFQGVKGVGTFQSGIDLIPFSLCGAFFSTLGMYITPELEASNVNSWPAHDFFPHRPTDHLGRIWHHGTWLWPVLWPLRS